MAPCGPLTIHSRMLMDNRNLKCTSPSGTYQYHNVGETFITVSYDGYTIREQPGLGLQPKLRTPLLPPHLEMQLLFPKLYRISQNRTVKTHPYMSLSHTPFISLNDMLTRATDDRLPSRSCLLTKV